jgi:hypothetical protein
MCHVALLVAWTMAPADPPKSEADPRAEYWQKELSRERTIYGDAKSEVITSMADFSDKAVQVELVSKPNPKRLNDRIWSLRFVRDNEVVFELEAAPHFAFVALDGIVFIAQYPPWATGCSVVAFDLTTGKELWQTKCQALGELSHFAYRNKTTIGLRPATGRVNEKQSVVAIQGDESFGAYTEILDPKTGKRLAHQAYRAKPTDDQR